MRLKITKNKNSESWYIIQSTYIDKKHSSKVVEKLGTFENVKQRANGEDPYIWVKKYIDNLNKQEKEGTRKIIKSYSPNKLISKNIQHAYNIGYFFLQDIYYKLGLNRICDDITNRYQFKYDLNDILSKLIYSRIIYPSSKLKTLELSKNFLESPNFEYQHILRSLEILSKESYFIRSELYHNSLKYSKRNSKVLFYDCTNYYFEIEEEDEFRKYGKSKEHRPNPIVEMGLFMDGDGIPLTFDTFPGNKSEQETLQPLEKRIIEDFHNPEIVVCTDAGLSSNSNRKFNDTNIRKFVTTQSLKKLKQFLKDWSLDLTSGWKLPGSDKTYNISKLREDEDLIKKFYHHVFYKERWIKENGLEQRLIITYSPKYQVYQKNIREHQINRALKIIENHPRKIGKYNENDPKRFISIISTTKTGEAAEENHYSLDQEKINEEANYDGLYAVCTNLEDDVEDIIKINTRRWEIEESFRIMKSEFKARPVHLSREDRIKAHFLTCFLALVIYRYLEKRIDEKYTVIDITDTLKNMNLLKDHDEYIPIYTRTDLIDLLHEKFNFRTDYEIITYKNLKKICKQTKS